MAGIKRLPVENLTPVATPRRSVTLTLPTRATTLAVSVGATLGSGITTLAWLLVGHV